MYDWTAASWERTLQIMRARQREGTRWAVYENQAMDSLHRGHLQFMHVGDGCTYAEPPPHYPDSAYGAGWKYRFVGFVDLDKGEILPKERE